MDDVRIARNPETDIPEIIETTVFPTVGEDTERQYICVTLQVLPAAGYPDVSPTFKLQKPRGLDDARLAEIKDACTKKLSESVGFPVVFDLIEVIREHLTGSNLPSGQCVVCLYGFQDGDEFTKTECYHYLHSYCLARHLVASRRNYNEEQDKLPAWQRKQSKPFEPVCPVCREPIKDDYDHLRTAMPPTELEMAPEFHLTEELRHLQTRMTSLFLHQKSRGGIIDAGAEENNVISLAPEEQLSEEQKNSEDAVDSTSRSDIPAEPHFVTPVQQPNAQTQRQQVSRSNHHRGGSSRNHSHASPAASTQRYTNESTNNNYSHHNRRHYNRGRRHHNHGHHHHYQQQSQQQAPANDQTSCSPSTR